MSLGLKEIGPAIYLRVGQQTIKKGGWMYINNAMNPLAENPESFQRFIIILCHLRLFTDRRFITQIIIINSSL